MVRLVALILVAGAIAALSLIFLGLLASQGALSQATLLTVGLGPTASGFLIVFSSYQLEKIPNTEKQASRWFWIGMGLLLIALLLFLSAT